MESDIDWDALIDEARRKQALTHFCEECGLTCALDERYCWRHRSDSPVRMAVRHADEKWPDHGGKPIKMVHNDPF